MSPTSVLGSRIQIALLALVIAASANARAKAAVVTPPPFETLVATAGEIFLGEVIGLSSRWDVRAGKRLIVTDVTYRTDEILKGDWSGLKTLTVAGGHLGNVRMDVPGMPTFMIGDRDVVFVRRGQPTLMPIVGLFHGRFRVVTGVGGVGVFVANNARLPLVSVANYVRPGRIGASARPLALADFLRTIRTLAGGR